MNFGIVKLKVCNILRKDLRKDLNNHNMIKQESSNNKESKHSNNRKSRREKTSKIRPTLNILNFLTNISINLFMEYHLNKRSKSKKKKEAGDDVNDL